MRDFLIRLLPAGLLQHRNRFHRQAHIAGDAQFALHESRGAIEFAFDHFVEGLQGQSDRAIGRLAVAVANSIRRGFAVDIHAARVTEIELSVPPNPELVPSVLPISVMIVELLASSWTSFPLKIAAPAPQPALGL